MRVKLRDVASEMKGSRLVYEAPPLTLGQRLLAQLTLTALFLLTLAYLVIAPLVLIYTWYYPNMWLILVSAMALTSPLWSRSHGPWRAFGKSAGFEAWRRYFRLRVYREAVWDRASGIMVALVPHGLFPLILPQLSAIQEHVFPEFGNKVPRTAVATAMLWTPVLAPMLRWLGCIPASREAIHGVLSGGGNVLIVPDGIAGAYHSHREVEQLFLSKRRGFIRTAIQEGALLVPAYCFGHTQLWDVWPDEQSEIAKMSRYLQFSLIWFWGEWWCPPLPHRVPLTLVLGAGMQLEKRERPSEDEVTSTLERFSQATSRLYYQHRALAGPQYESKELQIV